MPSRHPFLAALVAAAILPAAAPAAQQQQQQQQVRRVGVPQPGRVTLDAAIATVPLDTTAPRPEVQLTINGKGPYRFIFDTGASGTVITESLAEELELPIMGRAAMGSPGGGEPVPATIRRLDRASAGGVTVEGLVAVAADMSHVWKEDAPRGVLSATAFPGMLVTVDYAAGVLRVTEGTLPAADGQTIFEWPETERLPSVTVRVGEHELLAHVDTGAPGGLKLPESWATRLAFDAEPVAIDPARMVTAEIPQRRATLRETPRIGGHPLASREVILQTGPETANLGLDVLRGYVVTVDLANRRVKLEKMGTDPI